MSDFDRLPDAEPPPLEALMAFVVAAAGIAGALFAALAYLALA